VGAPIVVLALYYFYAWSTSKTLAHDPSPNAFIANILLLIPLSAVVCLTVMPQALRRWESRLGDLSYGIYLNHFLVAGLLLWLAETIGGEPFGHYGRPAFVLLVMAACALLATVTFNLVERPVEILRRRIKARSGAQPVVAPEPVPPIVTSTA
jgi:peptidoglycan/LPS O-acetylase OafA/YrhL